MRRDDERFDPANPRHYSELVALDRDAEDALIDCICAVTGIDPNDLDGDDWPLERLISALQGDYARLRHYEPTGDDLDRAWQEGERIETEQDALWNDDETE